MNEKEKMEMKRRVGETAISAIASFGTSASTLQRLNHLTAAQP
jgi:hypothetical protein